MLPSIFVIPVNFQTPIFAGVEVFQCVTVHFRAEFDSNNTEGNRASESVVLNSDQKMVLRGESGLCSNMLELLLEFL